MSEKQLWTTPFAQAGGAHSLSGSALADVAREVLARGHSFRFLAPGASMSPFIQDGDVVTLVPFEAISCAPGDVVAFIQPHSGRLVVHRVLSVAGNRCRIRGDNNSKEDGAFPNDAVLGTVSRVERAGQTVRIGLGPERALIALLSRWGWLCGCMNALRVVYSVVRRHS